MPGVSIKVKMHVRWYDQLLRVVFPDKIRQRLGVASTELVNRIKKNISKSANGGITPSKPGEYPRLRTGRLRNSIFWDWAGRDKTIVGSSVFYARILEEGHRANKIITPKRGQFLSWIDKSTGQRVYRRQVRMKPFMGRPFLKRSFQEFLPEFDRIVGRPISLGK